ncbi:hypothetical protein KFL_006900070 [Klebsormidium nitens]|uniref:Uncharacterized protein n=1 Tax=Klebsormidium nitens TaxID=105231 RepID=A0A1Y1INS9_KLENI|nr:hypothetical protein KFL_006900070 [Klebsormidium nitens]|eukprot:GAQ90831.1 hypothetical protein KFL_006900070 [Klebsormidium nitens]
MYPSLRESLPLQGTGDHEHDSDRKKRSAGVTRRELEWEQRERQEEAARREWKRMEIARRQQEAWDRRAASEHFRALSARADLGLQAAQRKWDLELDRRLGATDLTKVPLPAINLAARVVKWAAKRGHREHRGQDLRKEREAAVLRGHRVAFRSFLDNYTGRTPVGGRGSGARASAVQMRSRPPFE